jgi:hypothetical protein
MQKPAIHLDIDRFEFPIKKVHCTKKPFSRELLHNLLEIAYNVSPFFTGYLRIASNDSPLLFLFFLNGAPSAAGRYADSRPTCYSIQELGEHLSKSNDESRTITLCETDAILLKSMLLFLQEVPDIKAPTTLIDIENIVRHIGEVGENAMIALRRDNKINFFFFRDGKGTHTYYTDQAFERHEGMTIDEEMQLYAFQPGAQIEAFVFRTMATATAKESAPLDKDALYKLLTEGRPKNRRREDRRESPSSTVGGVDALINALNQQANLSNFVLAIDSGPQQGERFLVTLPCTIGRVDCDVTLDDRLISRRHAEIKVVDSHPEIEDLASRNGTKVNGEKITQKRLNANDLISIGPINLRIFPA